MLAKLFARLAGQVGVVGRLGQGQRLAERFFAARVVFELGTETRQLESELRAFFAGALFDELFQDLGVLLAIATGAVDLGERLERADVARLATEDGFVGLDGTRRIGESACVQLTELHAKLELARHFALVFGVLIWRPSSSASSS